MRYLVQELGMLTGISVVCGNRTQSASFQTGLAQEIVEGADGFGEAPLPITDRSLFDLASLTKLFTAIAVLQLLEAGKLSMDDAVGEKDKRFTGLRDTSLFETLCYQAVLRSPRRIDRQPDAAAAMEQVFLIYRDRGPEPDKRYSDINALVLKYLVETVSGLGFYDYLLKHVLIPCGMRETFLQVPADRLDDCLNYSLEHRLVAGEHLLLKTPKGEPHDPKAKLLRDHGTDLPGHAGLFSSAGDMTRLAQGLLRGDLISPGSLREMGRNRTGGLDGARGYRQYLGYLCFSKSPVQHLSELPAFMGPLAIGLSGYTGNHFALDPELGVFDIFLGNRCHNRLSVIEPASQAEALGLSPEGAGLVPWPDGRWVKSSWHYVYQKDRLLHQPVHHFLLEQHWITK
ncbi:MAG: serine hydrolase domain-containing protein [Christensenellales bacterium]